MLFSLLSPPSCHPQLALIGFLRTDESIEEHLSFWETRYICKKQRAGGRGRKESGVCVWLSRKTIKAASVKEKRVLGCEELFVLLGFVPEEYTWIQSNKSFFIVSLFKKNYLDCIALTR